jgi:hypothetical protein
MRDPLADHLLTPQNAALIDYQPSPLAGVHSMDRVLLVKIAVSRAGQRRGDGSVPANDSRPGVGRRLGGRRTP